MPHFDGTVDDGGLDQYDELLIETMVSEGCPNQGDEYCQKRTLIAPGSHHFPRLSSDDRACFEEIRKVILRHGKENSFGVTLLQSSIPVRDDEILSEIGLGGHGNIQ